MAGGSGLIAIAYPSEFRDIQSIGAGLTPGKSADTTLRTGYKVYTFTAGSGDIEF